VSNKYFRLQPFSRQLCPAPRNSKKDREGVIFPAGGRLVALLLLTLFANIPGRCQTLRDDAGHVFAPGAPPERIVSLAPNITEILFALGLGDKIVGVTRYCDYPPAALEKEKVGGFLDPDFEKIKSLTPDLVIGFRGNPLGALEKLRSIGLSVFVLDIGNVLEDVPRTIDKIGRIARRTEEARALVRSLSEKYRTATISLAGVTTKPRVFLSIHGLGLSTCGRESYFNDLLERAKSINVTGRIPKPWFEYTKESLIKDNPDVIIILAKSGRDFEAGRDWFKAQPGFEAIKAVRQGRFGFLDEDPASRFGPRLYDTFAELVRLIHPEGENSGLFDGQRSIEDRF